MIIRTEEQLAAVVDTYIEFDEFVVDLETVYIPTAFERAEAERLRAMTAKQRTLDEAHWLAVFDLKATDPRVNTINWIGLAGPGGSSVAIPVGHPKGRLVQPARVIGKPAFAVYEEGDPRRMTKQGKLSGRLIKIREPNVFEPPPLQLDIRTVIEALRPLFFSGKAIIGWNLKFDLKTLAKYFGTLAEPEWPEGRYYDVMNAVHLVDEKMRDYKLATVTKKVYDTSYDKLGKKGVQNFSFGKAARYTGQDCRYEWQLWRKYKARLQAKPSLWRFFQYEADFYEAIIRMEWEGVQVNKDMTRVLRAAKEKEIAALKDRMVVDFGAPPDFNPNARVQVQTLLYKRYKAPILKRTPTTKDPSVDAECLQLIAELEVRDEGAEFVPHPAAPVAQLLLDYAEQNKVLSTYLVGTVPRLDDQGRLHADYLLHGTQTSRLSCRDPNIQNIPREDEMRGMYEAPPGSVFVIGDYDQIELRYIGYFSGDPAMCELFISGRDIHRGTAALVLNKPFDDVTAEERQLFGKMPNFLLSYGGSAFNLHQKTGISEKQAERVLNNYFRQFNKINPWKGTVIRQCRNRARFEHGRMVAQPWVETMLGRRRRFPDLFAGNAKVVAAAERQVVNTLTQGAASETALLAMADLTKHCKKTGFPLRLVINVHDELVGTIPTHHAEEASELLASTMSGVRIPHTGERPLGDELPLAVKVVTAERWLK